MASGCGCKEVYRFPHITYLYSSCSCYFFSSIPTFGSFKKIVFRSLVYIISTFVMLVLHYTHVCVVGVKYPLTRCVYTCRSQLHWRSGSSSSIASVPQSSSVGAEDSGSPECPLQPGTLLTGTYIYHYRNIMKSTKVQTLGTI